MKLLDSIAAMFRPAIEPIPAPVKKRRAKARKPREADLCNPAWKYTAAIDTDVRRTFARFTQPDLPVNVAAIKRTAAK